MADDTSDSRDMSRWAIVKRAATTGPLSVEREISQDDIDGFLFEAVADGDIERVRYLLTRHPRPRINSRPRYGSSALDWASWNNHVIIMQLLINVGGAALSTTALKLAATNNKLEAITYLVGSSKDPLSYVNSVDQKKQSALHYAIGDGEYQEKTVRHLIDLGANAALKDVEGWNPAHHACDCPETSLNVLKVLIHSAGGSIGDQDLYENTYLHIASKMNKGEYVEWLLANGADPSITNLSNKTAWEIAVKESSFDVVGRFAYKEVEYRMRSEYHAKIPSHQDARVLHNYFNQIEWHRICDGNIKMLVYGQLSRLSERNVWSREEAIRLLNRNFHEENTTNNILGTRDTSCIFDNLKFPGDSVTEHGSGAAEKDEFVLSFVSIVMPFFHSTSPEALGKRSGIFKELVQSQYCCGENHASHGIHLPRALDEYCNPSLDTLTLDTRNMDQVVLRYQRKKAKSWSEDSPGVVTVPQAWLWKFGNVIMTALPSDIKVVNPLLDKNMVNSWDMSRTGQNLNTEQLLGLFLSDLVDVLDRPAMAGLSEPIFNIFEKAIVDLSERVDQYTQFLDVDSIKIVEEKEFLHEIDDIREELSMIKTVLFQQEEVWRDFANTAWPLYWPDGPGGQFKPLPETPGERDISEDERRVWMKIQRPQVQFAKFSRRIAKLDADAERVERAIDRKLDLKTKHASLKETHAMAIMSAAIFGFTIITIIFTPLSFVVALFALPIDRFQKQQVPSVWSDQAGMYSTNYMGKWIVTAELVSISLTLTIMWFMVEYGLRVPITDRIKKWAQGILKRLLNKIKSEEGDKNPPVSPGAENAGKSAGERQSKKKAKVSIDPSDSEDRSKKHQPRRRKWFPKREISKPDEEKGPGEDGKLPS